MEVLAEVQLWVLKLCLQEAVVSVWTSTGFQVAWLTVSFSLVQGYAYFVVSGYFVVVASSPFALALAPRSPGESIRSLLACQGPPQWH